MKKKTRVLQFLPNRFHIRSLKHWHFPECSESFIYLRMQALYRIFQYLFNKRKYVKIKLLISYREDKEWKLKKTIFKSDDFLLQKSRIYISRIYLECSLDSLDLPIKNIICKHDVIWSCVAYRNIRVNSDLALR